MRATKRDDDEDLEDAGSAMERRGHVPNPLDPIETGAVHHPWIAVSGLATLAATAWIADRKHLGRRNSVPSRAGVAAASSPPSLGGGGGDRPGRVLT